ncbi:MAG: hypothetical protein ACOCSK_01780, partial [Rhodothermales bacterium]
SAVVARRDLVHMAAILFAEHAREVIPNREVRVVHTLSEALKWLEIDQEAYAAAARSLKA